MIPLRHNGSAICGHGNGKPQEVSHVLDIYDSSKPPGFVEEWSKLGIRIEEQLKYSDAEPSKEWLISGNDAVSAHME